MDTGPETPSRHDNAQTILSRSQTDSSSSQEDGHPVARELLENIISEEDKGPYDGFLPNGRLQQILCDDAIKNVLRNILTKETAKRQQIDADDIRTAGGEPRRVKILAILLLMDVPCHIAKFIKKSVEDNQLPLKSRPPHKVFKRWSPAQIENFCKWQWVFLAPVIDFTSEDHQILCPKTPMPFLDTLEWNDAGAHGEVSKTRIHEDHQKWDLSQKPIKYYAIKRFYSGSEDKKGTFKIERAALAKFSRPNVHDNLIELLFSYEIEPYQFLIFPWADSNLQEYWRDKKSQPSESDDLIWLFKQCHGLADGLCEVHRYHGLDDGAGESLGNEKLGRHGDIKPQNILYFGLEGQRGRLVVADFTLMRFHAPNVDNTYANNLRGYSKTYRPPEVGRDIQVTQKYDIWTLGCVFLEFITWHLIGYDAIYEDHFKGSDGRDYESFGTVRLSDDNMSEHYVHDKFFIPVEAILDQEPKAQVKESVKNAMDQISTRASKCVRRIKSIHSFHFRAYDGDQPQ